jgi:hypothetical protein
LFWEKATTGFLAFRGVRWSVMAVRCRWISTHVRPVPIPSTAVASTHAAHGGTERPSAAAAARELHTGRLISERSPKWERANDFKTCRDFPFLVKKFRNFPFFEKFSIFSKQKTKLPGRLISERSPKWERANDFQKCHDFPFLAKKNFRNFPFLENFLLLANKRQSYKSRRITSIYNLYV